MFVQIYLMSVCGGRRYVRHGPCMSLDFIVVRVKSMGVGVSGYAGIFLRGANPSFDHRR